MSRLHVMEQHTDRVRQDASGRWHEILHALAPEFDHALARPGRHVTCPFHGGKNDFRVVREVNEEGRAHCTCGHWDGFGLLMKARSWDFPTTVLRVEEVIGGHSEFKAPAPKPAMDPVKQAAQDRKWIETMQRWWLQTVPLEHPLAKPARAYLKSRKIGSIELPLEDLGFHPELDYYDDDFKRVGRFPAIIAIVRTPDGRVSTVHRTYLTEDGRKAFEGEATRKQYKSPSTNPVQGGAIRLDKHVGPVLNLAEGIETALAVRAITGQPTWSTLNKELMKLTRVPAQTKLVTIWADRDAKHGGQMAAVDLMDRLRAAGTSAVVMLPPFSVPEGKKSLDWNDVVASVGLEEARNRPEIQQWLEGQAKFLQKRGLSID